MSVGRDDRGDRPGQAVRHEHVEGHGNARLRVDLDPLSAVAVELHRLGDARVGRGGDHPVDTKELAQLAQQLCAPHLPRLDALCLEREPPPRGREPRLEIRFGLEIAC